MSCSPADLLMQGRTAAGLTQREAALKAGTSQSALARYESGAVIPTLPTLERLLLAVGRRLELRTVGVAAGDPTATSMRGQLGDHARTLRRSRAALLRAAHRHGVGAVTVFGSVSRGDATPASDVDLLVELSPGRTLLDLASFQLEAHDILGLPVDVATPDMLKQPVRERALAEALPL